MVISVYWIVRRTGGIVWLYVTALMAVTACVYAGMMHFSREADEKRKKYRCYSLALSLGLLAAILLTMYNPMHRAAEDFFHCSGAVGIAAWVLSFPLWKGKGALAWYIGLPTIWYAAFMILADRTMGVGRLYYSIVLLAVVLVYLFKTDIKAVQGVAAAAALLLMVSLTYKDYRYVYRDSDVWELTAPVTEGVYKGIYTTPVRARCAPELERYLQETVGAEEAVSFRDNAPLAYLMHSQNPCDIRTWDEMRWPYGSDPRSMYRYYKNRDKIPDVIVYIDRGGSPLSIESPPEEFPFNRFVDRYYQKTDETFENDLFRVLVYRNNHTFEYDFDELLASVQVDDAAGAA